MATNKINKEIPPEKALKYLSYLFLTMGTFLVGSFALRGGPHKGIGDYLLTTELNPYLDIQFGIALLLIGVAIRVTHKITIQLDFADNVMDFAVRTEVAIILLALVLGTIAYAQKSIGIVLAYMMLYLLVPFVLIITLLSLIRYKKILSGGYSYLFLFTLTLNWLVLFWGIYNITD